MIKTCIVYIIEQLKINQFTIAYLSSYKKQLTDGCTLLQFDLLSSHAYI